MSIDKNSKGAQTLLGPNAAELFLRTLTFQDLQLLKSVVECRSLTSAAEHVGLSIPGASRRLSQMRDLFKDELFIRAGHEMLPTIRMRTLTELVDNLLTLAGGLTEQNEEFSLERETRTVRILSTDNVVPAFLSPMLKLFYKQAPNANVSVGSIDDRILERIRSGQSDMAVCAGAASFPADFNTLELYQSNYAVMLGKNHPLVAEAEGGRVSPASLEGYRNVHVASTNSTVTMPCPIRLPSGFETPFFLSIPDVLDQTDFVFVGPELTLERLRENCNAELAILKLPEDVGSIETKLVWHQSTHRDPFLQWVRGLVTHVSRMEARRFLEGR